MTRDLTSGELALTGIDGANPLGFLAAAGALVTACGAGEDGARLHFRRSGAWTPVLSGISACTPESFSELVARGLRGRQVSGQAEQQRAATEEQFNHAKKAADDMKKELRKRGLKGNERKAAMEAELEPLERVRNERRDRWLEALSAAVPRPELALGKRIDCTSEEYRGHALSLLRSAGPRTRDSLDLLAAFGTDACLAERSDSIEPTPFCFITGSGHQYFLDTVRQLMDCISAEKVRETLFEPWSYRDDGLSMRWDPLDDRRYALMDRDPTASDNKSRTVWMANLLGYRALALFPAAPRHGSARVTAWTDLEEGTSLTWPIWDFPATSDAIRSLLQLRELTEARPDPRALHARGIRSALRATRIKVGSGANFKWNFSPARAVL